MSFWDSFAGTTKRFLSPSALLDLTKKAPRDMIAPVRTLFNTNPIKTPGKSLGALVGTGLTTVFPGFALYKALQPNRMDLDTAGAFEEMGTRGTDVLTALSFANSRLQHSGSLPGTLLGTIIGMNALNAIGRYGGRAIDNLADTTPDPNEMASKFQQRVSEISHQLAKQFPTASDTEIRNEAIQKVLSSASGYLQLFNR